MYQMILSWAKRSSIALKLKYVEKERCSSTCGQRKGKWPQGENRRARQMETQPERQVEGFEMLGERNLTFCTKPQGKFN